MKLNKRLTNRNKLQEKAWERWAWIRSWGTRGVRLRSAAEGSAKRLWAGSEFISTCRSQAQVPAESSWGLASSSFDLEKVNWVRVTQEKLTQSLSTWKFPFWLFYIYHLTASLQLPMSKYADMNPILQMRKLRDRRHLEIITEEPQYFPRALGMDRHELYSLKRYVTSLRRRDRTIQDAKKNVCMLWLQLCK